MVAVHISSALSGTYGAAETTAAQIGSAIRVIDSKSTAMDTGFVALAAARAAADGADLDTVAEAAADAVSRNHGFIVVHQLDNLRRSGRIGGAGAWLGTKLSLKPLLRIDDGKLVLAQRVRTVSKAMATMIDRVCDVVGERSAASRCTMSPTPTARPRWSPRWRSGYRGASRRSSPTWGRCWRCTSAPERSRCAWR